MTTRLGDRFAAMITETLEKKYNLQSINTGAVAPGLHVVRTDTANFYVLESGNAILCIDTGYRPLVIKSELLRLGIPPEKITHVFLSHADVDHVGGLRLFKNAEIYLSAAEEPMIRGLRTVWGAIRTPRIRRAYHLLRENDVVLVGDTTVRAIETPGHTPGSMAYLVGETFLFTGDTLKLKDGMAYAGKHYTMDYETQKASIRKLAGLTGIGWVLTAHSGYTQDVDKAFDYWREKD